MVIRDTQTDLRGGTVVHDDGNGGSQRTQLKLERSDYLKGATAIFGAIGAALAIVVPLAMYVFQTQADATAVHTTMNDKTAAIEKQLAVDAAVAKVEAEHRERLDGQVASGLNALNERAKVQHTNTQRIMWELELKPKPMPAGLDVDLDDSP